MRLSGRPALRLKDAERRRPASEKVLRALAALSLSTGRGEQAAGYYARMVELFPDAEDIDEMRNTLKVLKEKPFGEAQGGKGGRP